MKKATLGKGRRGVAFVVMMLMLLTSFVFSPLATNVSAAGPVSGERMPGYRVIAYVTQWNWPGTYDAATDTATTTVDPWRITHINYAFGHIVNAQGTAAYSNGNQNAAQFPGTVDVPDPGKLKALVALKQINPDLKILLSVGGWGMDGFCPIVHSAAKRKIFIESCIEICKRFGLDGIDLDYEYPGTSADKYDRLSCSHDPDGTGAQEGGGLEAGPGGADGVDYLTLFKEFRNNANFGWNYLLTIASGVGFDWNVCVPIAQYPDYLDFINIMIYDIYGEWRNHSEFNANVFPSGNLSNDTEEGGGKVLSYDLAVNRLHFRGYPSDIMNVGIPMYGRERYYRRSTADGARVVNDVTPLPAGLGDASWMTFDQIQNLYNASSSTSSDILKNILFFEDIATDPLMNKTTVGIGKGGVVAAIGGYTKEEAAQVTLEFVSNTVKRVWNTGPRASYASGDLTVRVTSSPKSEDVGKTIKRTYSVTYDDIEDIVAKTEWIQDLGFGGGMYWEYSQDSKSGSPLTAAVWNGLNGTRGSVTQPARGNGDSPKTLTTGRKGETPVISYRYDKSKSTVTRGYDDWDSRQNMQSGLTQVTRPDGTINYYGKIRFFQGKLYENLSGNYHGGYYGVLPCLAPAYATSDNNMYVWMRNRNSGFNGQYGSAAEWKVVGEAAGYPETQIARNEYGKPLHAPDSSALQINSAAPNKKQVKIGDTISYNVDVSGGSGSYTSIVNQVWFEAIKYDNVDGYLKFEHRRTGGPYPIPTLAGYTTTNKQKAEALVYGTSGLTKVALDNAGEKRSTIAPSPANAEGTVTFTATTPGTYFLFTEAVDSTGKHTAQFSQVVEVLEPGALDLSADVTHNAGASVNVGTAVTATGVASGDDAVGLTYKFEFFMGTELVHTRDFAAANTAEYTPNLEGTYTVKLTVKNSTGDTDTATSAPFRVVQPLIIVSVTPVSLAAKTLGTFQITAAGGTGGYVYSLMITKDNKLNYYSGNSSSNSFNYAPMRTGSYLVRASCQDSAGTSVVKEVTLVVS